MEKKIYTYRLLTEEQAEQAINGEDIIADDPHAETSIQEHLLRGLSRNPTPYLSTSAWLPGLFAWAFEEDNLKSTLIQIELNENIDFIDLRNKYYNENTLGLAWRPSHYAQAKREILIKGVIPKENYRIIRHGKEHNVKRWKPFKKGLTRTSRKEYEKCKNKQERIEVLTNVIEKYIEQGIRKGFSEYILKNIYVCLSYLNLENTKSTQWYSITNIQKGLNNG